MQTERYEIWQRDSPRSHLSARFELQWDFKNFSIHPQNLNTRKKMRRLGYRITLRSIHWHTPLRNSRALAFTLRQTLDPEKFREAFNLRESDVAHANEMMSFLRVVTGNKKRNCAALHYHRDAINFHRVCSHGDYMIDNSQFSRVITISTSTEKGLIMKDLFLLINNV